MAALHFLLPTGDSRSGRSSFDSKLISLLPLDDVPVHVPLRRPRPLRFERLRMSGSECGIHRAETASALRSRKTEGAAKEKPTPISQFFLAPTQRGGIQPLKWANSTFWVRDPAVGVEIHNIIKMKKPCFRTTNLDVPVLPFDVD